jgi:transposase
MAMGRRKSERQESMWIAAGSLASPGHPFYTALNRVLAAQGFDRHVEGLCEKFYAKDNGRPGTPPGVYFRLLLVGYFEGIGSERGIDWRCADSLSLHEFLGVPLGEKTPDHSTISRTRRLIDVETHQEVFAWVLKLLAEHDLVSGRTLGIDATTLEANAAMRSIVRRDTKQSYEEFLIELAKASGIETPTREDLARIDRNRKGKGSNEDWEHPLDPDARITRMKDGRTHLAHKLEQAADMETGAIVGLTVQHADKGDTATLPQTLTAALEQLSELKDDAETEAHVDDKFGREVVADKGYHSDAVLSDLAEAGIRSYVSAPRLAKGKRRRWKGKEAQRRVVLANRRRVRGKRGRALMRKRGELLERPFAHELETGGMRRTHVRGHPEVLKRVLGAAAGFNIGLLMRALFGVGKPRVLQGVTKQARKAMEEALAAVVALLEAILGLLKRLTRVARPVARSARRGVADLFSARTWACSRHIPTFATGC